jgi:uncharacterized membrane protein (Fun14 family)
MFIVSETDITKQQIMLLNKLSSDDNSIESSFTVYPKENGSSENELQYFLAERETKAVRCLKCFVIGVLFIAAVVLSVTTYILISKNEDDLFVSGFVNDANRLKLVYYEVTIQRISVSAAFIIRYLMQSAMHNQDPIDTKIIGT